MARVNPEFATEITRYGAGDFKACFNCGNCTATCSLSTTENSFPREMVRYSMLGLEAEIKASLKPWECYYCGECSSQCPRQANPGELMMSLRRWLTAKYDWTGLSGLLYKSFTVSLLLFLLTTIGVIGYSAALDFQTDKLMHIGHSFEMIAIGSVFVVFFLPNLIRMWWFVIGSREQKIPLTTYFKSVGELFIHMFTQKRALNCDDNQTRWFEHLILVFGYLALLFTTVFLDWFSSKSMFVIILGYAESAVVFTVTFDFMRRRMQKEKEISKHSQPSDWFFVIWLFLMGLTAFLVRLLIDFNLIEQNGWLYLIHITVLVQWALLIVPFGKWTHFLYRSFAMYFAAIKKIR